MAPELHRLSYAAEKFSQAEYELAIGAGRMKERLHSAFMVVMRLSPEDLPEPLDERLRDLHTTLTRVEAKGSEGTLQATLDVISEDEAVDAAREILDLSSLVQDAYKDRRTTAHKRG